LCPCFHLYSCFHQKQDPAHVQQNLDFVSAMEAALMRSPNSSLLVWEDDCFMCSGTLTLLQDTAAALSPCFFPWGKEESSRDGEADAEGAGGGDGKMQCSLAEMRDTLDATAGAEGGQGKEGNSLDRHRLENRGDESCKGQAEACAKVAAAADAYNVSSVMQREGRPLPGRDPWFGAIKVGNGGSGMLFHPSLSWPLVTYLRTHRGSLNVDVSMWRFLMLQEKGDYISKETYSAQ
jgi:hypothetical protein